MARDMSDKEILQMELAQLKIEVSTTRTAVSISLQYYTISEVKWYQIIEHVSC